MPLTDLQIRKAKPPEPVHTLARHVLTALRVNIRGQGLETHRLAS